MSALHDKQEGFTVRSQFSDTPRTDQCTYPADCLGKTLVVNAEWARVLERENAALKQRCETCETAAVIDSYVRENAALRAAAVEVCAIARVWATIWHDKLSSDSLVRFAELEQQVLIDAAKEGKQ